MSFAGKAGHSEEAAASQTRKAGERHLLRPLKPSLTNPFLSVLLLVLQRALGQGGSGRQAMAESQGSGQHVHEVTGGYQSPVLICTLFKYNLISGLDEQGDAEGIGPR